MPFARGGLLAPLRQESAERLAVHLTGGVEAFLALVLLKRLLRLLTHDAVGRTGIEAAAVQGLLQHAGLRPVRWIEPDWALCVFADGSGAFGPAF